MLYTWKLCNIINQLYFNLKKLEKIHILLLSNKRQKRVLVKILSSLLHKNNTKKIMMISMFTECSQCYEFHVHYLSLLSLFSH